MTKSFKRVALVAAAALTLGGLTGVAAHAAVTSFYVSNASSVNSVTVTAANSTAYKVLATDQISDVTALAGKTLTLNVKETGSGAFATDGTLVRFVSNTLGVLGSATVTDGDTSEDVTFTAPLVGGSYPGYVQYTNSTGASVYGSVAFTLNVTAAPAFSVGLSKVIIGTSAPLFSDVDPATTISADATAAKQTKKAVIGVYLRDATNAKINGVALSAVVTGPALVVASGSGTATDGSDYSYGGAGNLGGSAAFTAATMASKSTAYFAVAGNGIAGTATIAISATDPVTSAVTVLATKTIVFTGAITKLTATNIDYITKPNNTAMGCGSATCVQTSFALTPAVTVAAFDAAGNPVAFSSAITGTSADTTVISASSCTADDASGALSSSKNTVAGSVANCSVTGSSVSASGKSTTIVYSVGTKGASGYVESNPVTITLGGSAAKFALSLDASSYQPGQAMSMTLTGTDSTGNPSADGTQTWSDATIGGGDLSSTVAITGATLPDTSAGFTMRNGKKTWTGLYAPVSEGDFTISGTDGVTGAAITASATVTGNTNIALEAATAAQDAANSAAEAADNATQAANDALAAVNSLAVQVASLVAGLKSQLTSLANLVSKISKKVGVK